MMMFAGFPMLSAWSTVAAQAAPSPPVPLPAPLPLVVAGLMSLPPSPPAPPCAVELEPPAPLPNPEDWESSEPPQAAGTANRAIAAEGSQPNPNLISLLFGPTATTTPAQPEAISPANFIQSSADSRRTR